MASQSIVRSPRRPPVSLVVAGLGWALLGLGCAVPAFVVQQSRELTPALVGGDIVDGQLSDAPATLWLLGSFVVATLAVLLVYAGQAWTVYPLVVLGVVVVIALSALGTPVALMAMAGLLIGTASLGGEAAYAYVTTDARA